MRLALKEAAKGRNLCWPNPMVGAVLVRSGRLLAKGWHRQAGGPHAEIEALKRAGKSARGATLYVSLEPCRHHGMTPPCTEAILAAGIKRVVAACPDPNPKAAGGLAWLKRHGIQISAWVLRGEAEALNQDFFRSIRLKRPWFVVKAGASLDGKTALSSGESKWITSEKARLDARRLRGACDAILVGAGTVAKDNPKLLPGKIGPFVPWRIILDPKGRLMGSERVFSDRYAHRTIWLAGPGLSPKSRAKFGKRGGSLATIKARGLQGFVRQASSWMAKRPLRRVWVEGGAQTLGAFLDAGLADEVVLYLAPKLMGGMESRGIFSGHGPGRLARLPKLEALHVEHVGSDLKVTAYVQRHH
jgi:diaminohydroxyphosphoribosylaminopyrimidine deaminase/5-amino-6-(5-phosphoribosylamino)uracil reductase